MTSERKVYSGSCLCGAVTYEIAGPLRPVVGCHCRQCQKTSGHYVAATQGYWQHLHLKHEDGLAWYRSSDTASRAFCKNCGSSLFWRRHGNELFSIMAGTLDQPTGLHMECHIHVQTKADYFELSDGLPAIAQEDIEHLTPKPGET
ncbi:GFA family protein [Pelagibius sp. Alg239-R121]|uniref:GFA family protein n=1 Tax=Pelagibius sp. Alg239-R121 TaxID=2993448 RepID=UPI0024A6616D|nr:GFA family protein [Pelagibius sp. Alg239-R121]